MSSAECPSERKVLAKINNWNVSFVVHSISSRKVVRMYYCSINCTLLKEGKNLCIYQFDCMYYNDIKHNVELFFLSFLYCLQENKSTHMYSVIALTPPQQYSDVELLPRLVLLYCMFGFTVLWGQTGWKALSAAYRLKWAAEDFHRPVASQQYRLSRGGRSETTSVALKGPQGDCGLRGKSLLLFSSSAACRCRNRP